MCQGSNSSNLRSSVCNIVFRLHLEQARVRKRILSVVDAHGALPVLNLDFLLPEGSRQPLILGDSPSYRLELGDWSIVSGGADGTVVQWSILGFSSGQAASGSKEDVRLHKIGAYEATRSGRSMKKIARSGLIGGSRIHDKVDFVWGDKVDFVWSDTPPYLCMRRDDLLLSM